MYDVSYTTNPDPRRTRRSVTNAATYYLTLDYNQVRLTMPGGGKYCTRTKYSNNDFLW